MLRCRDIVRHADSYLAGELPFWGRVGFRVHLLFCRYCRRYMRNLALTEGVVRVVPVETVPAEGQVDALLEMIRRDKA